MVKPRLSNLVKHVENRMSKKPSVDKKGKTYISRWNMELHEDRIKVGSQDYFCWDGKYFDRESRAVAHMKTIQSNPNWGLKVFRSDMGWGVFAEV